MKKSCWICKRTEEDFLKQKEEILKQIEIKICEHDDFEKNIVSETSKKLGFTYENKDKVRKIKCLDVTLSAILDNEKYFLDTNPDIQILLDYYKIYLQSKENRIDKNKQTLKEISDLFCNEPIESRYKSEINKNQSERRMLIDKREKIKSIKTSFILQKVEPKFYSQPEKQMPETHYEKCNNTGRTYAIPVRPHPDISYSSLGFQFEEEISLCPVCSTLFLQAAEAVFETRVAQIKANAQQEEYDDWDDDEDL